MAQALKKGLSGPTPEAADETLVHFEALWKSVQRPPFASVRAEGLEHLHLGALQSPVFALRYLRKWATLTFAHPPEVAAHFAANALVLRLLASEPPSPTAPAVVARLGLVGDCMWMRDHWSSFPSPSAAALLRRLHGVVANLETVLHAENAPPTDPLWLAQSLLPDMVTYSSPASFLDAFRLSADGSADGYADGSVLAAVSTANNHSLDLGTPGAHSTLAALDAARIPHSGIRIEGRPDGPSEEVGLYAATFGVNLADRVAPAAAEGVVVQTLPGLAEAAATGAKISDGMRSIDFAEISAALADMSADGCELLFVSVHWGHEFEGYPTPLQMQVGRILVQLGADVVLGSHAHLQQPFEVFDVNGYADSGEPTAAEAAALRSLPAANRLRSAPAKPRSPTPTPNARPRKALVCYCLGNFCTTMFNELCRVGLLAVLEAHVLFRPPGAQRRLLHICSDVRGQTTVGAAGAGAGAGAQAGDRGGSGRTGGVARRKGGAASRSPSPPPAAGRRSAPANAAAAARRGRGRAAGGGDDDDGGSDGDGGGAGTGGVGGWAEVPGADWDQIPERKRALVAFARAHVLGTDPTAKAQAPPVKLGF